MPSVLSRMCGNYRFAHAYEPSTKAVCRDALGADARALKEKVQFVRAQRMPFGFRLLGSC